MLELDRTDDSIDREILEEMRVAARERELAELAELDALCRARPVPVPVAEDGTALV